MATIEWSFFVLLGAAVCPLWSSSSFELSPLLLLRPKVPPPTKTARAAVNDNLEFWLDLRGTALVPNAAIERLQQDLNEPHLVDRALVSSSRP